MDPLTQGALGASLACAFSKKNSIKIAAICGAIGGMAPDLDVFIRSNIDPLLSIEYHRHFTHSLFFIPFGSLLVALFLKLLTFKNEVEFKKIYFFTFLGYATHGLLDACTSYGTRLYWPFSDLRVTWNIISIVDPIFTATLVIFCITGILKKSEKIVQIGIVIALSYLSFGLYNHIKVKSIMEEHAKLNNHKIERILLNPTIGNNILWRVVYKSGENYFVNAVNIIPFSNPIIYEGLSVKTPDINNIISQLPENSPQINDIERFSYFSQDYIYIHPNNDKLIADLRYGSLPNNDKSLWGIKIDPKNPDKHVQFVNLRNFKDDEYDKFWSMLMGE